MKKISIIVPVFNKEKYIRRCVESLLAQTMREIEVILIDDGSTDRSLEACEQCALQDARIRLVIQEANQGPSEARNTGIRIAAGEYLMFVDADDYIEPDSCEKLYEIAALDEKTDIVVGERIYHFFDNRTKELFHTARDTNRVFGGQEYLFLELRDKTMYFVIVANLYRREWILEQKLFLKKGMYAGEDEDWVPRAFILGKRVRYSGVLVYHHCETANSVMKSNKEMLDRTHAELCYELDAFIRKYAEPKVRNALENHLFYIYTESIASSELYRKEKRWNMREGGYFFVLKIAHGTKNYIKALLLLLNKRGYYEAVKLVRRLKSGRRT